MQTDRRNDLTKLMDAFWDYAKASKYTIVRNWEIVSEFYHNFFVALCFKLRRFA